MITDDVIRNETDFVERFSPFINKNEDGTYSFEESPMGLWVSFPKEELITISGWEGPDPANPIREKTFRLPLPASALIELFYAREDASRIICREERDPINDHPGVVWKDDQVVWRKVWHYLGRLDMRLEGEELIAFFEKDYKKQEEVNMKDTLISNFCVDACKAANADHPFGTSDVCEVAHKVLVTMHPEIESHDVENPEGVFHYTSQSQDLFNGYFDEVEGALNDIGLEYNSYNSTWVVKGGSSNAELV